MVQSRRVKGAGSARPESAPTLRRLAPGQRWSASRKRDVVLRLLCGESLDAFRPASERPRGRSARRENRLSICCDTWTDSPSYYSK